MKYFLLFLVLGCIISDVDGQRLFERKRPDIIPLDGSAKRIGWFVGPGLTYTLAPKDGEDEVFRDGDTSSVGIYDYQGQLGVYLEAGITWFTRDPVIVDYFDFGLAYKNLRGRMDFTGLTTIGGTPVMDVTGDSYQKIRAIVVQANANKFIPTGDYQFLQLSLGVNADFDLFGDAEGGADGTYLVQSPAMGSEALFPYLKDDNASPGFPRVDVHFKLGYGFKVRSKVLVIPAIETPVYTFMPEDNGFGQLRWFNTDFRPLILTVRFLFLRARNGFDCPPPIKHKGEIKTYKQDGYHPK